MRLTIIILLVSLTGCSNNITFYQATRSSLTVESNAMDVNNPVQGNFGYKNRTFIYNPRIGDNKEVMAMIGDSQFNVVDNEQNDEVITFRTALISGDAAASLSGQALNQAAEALSGTLVIPSYSTLAKTSFKHLCQLNMADFDQSKQLILSTREVANMATANKTLLENRTQVGLTNYNQKLHDELSQLVINGVCI